MADIYTLQFAIHNLTRLKLSIYVVDVDPHNPHEHLAAVSQLPKDIFSCFGVFWGTHRENDVVNHPINTKDS